MKLRSKILAGTLAASLVVGSLVGSIGGSVFAAIDSSNPLHSSADTIVDRLNAVHAEMTELEKQAVRDARDEVVGLWPNVDGNQAQVLTENLLGDIWGKILLAEPNISTQYPNLKANLFYAFYSMSVMSYSPGFNELEGIRISFSETFDDLAAIAGTTKPSVSDISTFFTEVEAAVKASFNNITDLASLLNAETTIKNSIQTAIDGSATNTAAAIEATGITATDIKASLDNIEAAIPNHAAIEARNALTSAYIRLILSDDTTTDPVTDPGTGTTSPGTGTGSTLPANAAETLDTVSKMLDKLLADLPADNKGPALEQAKKSVQKAIEEASVLNVSANVQITNGVAKTTLDAAKLAVQFQTIKENAKKVNDQLQALNAKQKQAKVVATINLGAVAADKSEVLLSKALVDEAKGAGIDAISVQVNGVSLEIALSDLGEDTTMNITKELKTKATDVTNLPIASEVFEFTFTSSNNEAVQFKEPVIVKVPVTTTEGMDTELLTLAKIVDGDLIIYGGMYNDEEGSFNAKRNSFSSYTVVENKIVFNDTASVKRWAGRQIEVAASKGIIDGRGEGVFDPGAHIKRAEFAKLIVKTFGLENSNAVESFTDVNSSDWFQEYVAAAAEAGIVNGKSAVRFDPHGKITRAEMATMASRALTYALEYNGVEDVIAALNSFVDASEIHATLQDGVAMAAAHGIVIGQGESQFNPNGNATRAEAAVVIYRLLNK